MHPRCSEAFVNIAYILQSAGRQKRAWSIFNSVLAINPRCVSALDGRAIVHYNRKNYFSALMDISKAIECEPKNAELHTNRGVIYQALEDRNSALQSYKACTFLTAGRSSN